jgi:hypothetical protein
MATRKKLLHLKSGVVNANNTPKLPTSEQIELGEIAINYADGYETLAIKNSEGEIIPFTNSITMMEYVDSAISGLSITPVQTTGDSTTKMMSQSAVTRELSNKLAVSDFNTYSGSVNTAIGNKVDKVDGKGLSTNDFTTEYKDKLDGIASGANVNVQADWTEADDTADSFINNKPNLGTASAKGVSNGITNSENLIEAKHVYSGVVSTASYNSTAKTIDLKSVSGNVLASIDATDFIKDGMVSNVEIKEVSGSTSLVISFNTDSGKEDIVIPISDIFDATNYYQKSETSGASEIETALSQKANTATTLSGYGIIDAKIENGVITLGNNTITPLTSVTIPVTSVTTSSTDGSISVNGSDVAVHGLGNAAYLNTGTTAGTVATGDHSHNNYALTSTTISTASGLTGGGDLSANRTIGLAATGTAGTYKQVVVDTYGRVISGNTEGGGGVPAANYFIIGDTEGSESVPEFDAYTDTVHVTQQTLTTAQKAQARTNIGALTTSDLSGYATETWVGNQGYATETWVGNQNFENKVAIVTADSVSLTAEVNKYYRYDSAVGTLAITLPVPSDTTHLSSIVFAFTTDSPTNVTFASSVTIKYQDGYEIEASTSYEINAIYNGSYWALAAIKLV